MSTNNKNDAFNGVNTQVLNTVYNALRNQPEMAKATFYVKSQWNGGFSVTSSSKGFRVGGQNIERNPEEYKIHYDFPNQFSGEGKGLTVCEYCMGSLAACLAQTIVAHATSRGIQIDGINIDVEGDVDLRGFTGISSDLRPGAQQFRVNTNIKRTNNQLHEIGKRFSPAFDTLTNGTSVVLVNS